MTQSETDPIKVLSAESQRLEAFAGFWKRRIDIEKKYLDDLRRLRIPHQSGNGQLQELAQKTQELLGYELDERSRGLEKLQAAYKKLTDELRPKEGPNYFEEWGRAMGPSLLRIDSLAAELVSAEATAGRLVFGAIASEEPPLSPSLTRRDTQRSSILFRRDSYRATCDTSSLLSTDSAYRQMVQKINDEKYIIENEIVPQTTRYVGHDKNCIVALKQIVSTFSNVHSDLALVLNNTAGELRLVSSSVDATIESTSFARRLGESFTSLVQPYRYKSYEIFSAYRPTTMLFGCPLPDDLDSSTIGERAVAKAFEAILSSAAKMHPTSLYQAICDSHKQQGKDIKLVEEIKLSALELEALWDPSQPDGGPEAVEHLAKARSDGLLVYFLTRLPAEFLPLSDSEITTITKMDTGRAYAIVCALAKAGNKMGTARRCNLAKLFLALRKYQDGLQPLVVSRPEGVQMITRIADLRPRKWDRFGIAIQHFDIAINRGVSDSLKLPKGYLEELMDAGLLT